MSLFWRINIVRDWTTDALSRHYRSRINGSRKSAILASADLVRIETSELQLTENAAIRQLNVCARKWMISCMGISGVNRERSQGVNFSGCRGFDNFVMCSGWFIDDA